jgi:hypothetical protein
MEFKSVTVVRDSKELSQMAELMPGNFESTGRIGFVASTLTAAVEAAGSMRPSRFAASEARLSRAGCGLRAGALSAEPLRRACCAEQRCSAWTSAAIAKRGLRVSSA